jgi:hypothetical protein
MKNELWRLLGTSLLVGLGLALLVGVSVLLSSRVADAPTADVTSLRARALVLPVDLRKGSLVGYVGTTGNAPSDVPHLHFSILELTPARVWCRGAPVNPFLVWVSAK